MPKAILTVGEWKEVQDFVETTGDFTLAAKEFNIPVNAIHQKAHQKGWITPKKLAEATLMEEAKKAAKALSPQQALSFVSQKDDGALTSAAQKMLKLREEMPPLIAEKLSEKIKRALTKIGDPSNYKELASAVSMLSTMLGLNKSGGVTVNVASGMDWSSQGSKEKPIVVVTGEEAS